MKKEKLVKNITRYICNKSLLIHKIHSSIYEKLDYNQRKKFKLYQVMQKLISKLIFGNAYCDMKYGERIESNLMNFDLIDLENMKIKLNNIIFK